MGEQIARLAGGQRVVWLERAGEQGLETGQWALRGTEEGRTLGDRVFAPAIVGRLEGALLLALEAFHVEQSLSLGAHRRELRRGRLAHLTERVFDALVDRLAQAGMVVGPPLEVLPQQRRNSVAPQDPGSNQE